jgi:hypothetical protein
MPWVAIYGLHGRGQDDPGLLCPKQKSGEESQELMPDFAARNELVVLDN